MNHLLSEFTNLFPVWNTTRAAGITSYLLFFISIAAGISQGFFSPRLKIKLNTLHQSAGWFGLMFGMVHGFVLVFDKTESLSLLEVFVPFASSSRRVSIGIGILALYSLFLLIITSDMMKVIGKRVWRMIHFLSFPGYLLALIHGIILGPDTSHLAIFLMYLMTGTASLILFLIRMGTVRKKKTSKAPIP